MCDILRNEFTVSKLFFQYDGDPLDVIQCQWTWMNRKAYMVYRVAIFIIIMSILIELGVESHKFFIYMTNWGFIILTLNFTVKAVCALKYLPWRNGGLPITHLPSNNVQIATESSLSVSLIILIFGTGHEAAEIEPIIKTPRQSDMSLLLKFSWFLHNIASTLAVFISITFWTVLAPRKSFINHGSYEAHLLNTIVILIDLALVATPFQLVHCYQPFIIGAIYLCFNGTYWALGGTDPRGEKAIYPITDWSRLDIAIPGGVFGSLFGVCLTHAILWCLTIVRQRTAGVTSSKSSQIVTFSHKQKYDDPA